MKLLVEGFSTRITRARQELRVLVHPSSIDLPSRALRFLTTRLRVRQREIGARWRRLPASLKDEWPVVVARTGAGIDRAVRAS